jgi:hypothetical protein
VINIVNELKTKNRYTFFSVYALYVSCSTLYVRRFYSYQTTLFALSVNGWVIKIKAFCRPRVL